MPEQIPMENEIWNVGQGYSNYHFLLSLVECRKLIKVCLHGVEELGMDYGFNPEMLVKNKINAMYRLIHELLQIIQDCIFIMDKKTKLRIKELEERTYSVLKTFKNVAYTVYDQRNGRNETKLVPEHFENCLAELRYILQEIKIPLNDKNLIFRASDDVDLETMKQQIIEGG